MPPSVLSLSLSTASGMSVNDSAAIPTSTHSRDSSGASEIPTPSTSTFSIPDHSRVASSTSSLGSTPPYDRMDSPTLPVKSVLHDLVEDPSEREDHAAIQGRYRAHSYLNDESDFYSAWSSQIISRTSCDYDLSDGFHSENDLPSGSGGRRGSNELDSPVSALKTRLSQRMPSLSRKLRDKRSFSSLNFQSIRSAPASRAPSIRCPPATKSVVSVNDMGDFGLESPPVPILPAHHFFAHQTSTELSLPTTIEEPVDRQMLSSTPLLPPCMMERKQSETGSVKSPLQSPTIADSCFSFPTSSVAPPLASTMYSPALSCKTSTASFSASRASQARSSSDFAYPMDQLPILSTDEWSDRLGHANFEILPTPYTPVNCDLLACRALTADWESARKQYFGHAGRVSEDYGPTSNTFKLTEQKWASIDAQWKQNFDFVVARAVASGFDVETVPCLSDSSKLTKLPSIDNPDSEAKRLNLADNGEIVGPMVTYVSRIKPQSKMTAFRRFFSELHI